MADTVLDSFLVKLAFKVDDPSKKHFDETLAAIEKRFAAIGAAAATAAVGIGFAVKKISENLGELWYAAQAAQSSTRDMNAFAFAIEQAGGKAGEGAAELKTFTDYVKSTAGQGAFANWFKVPFDVAHPVNSLMVAIDQLSAQYAKGGAAQATAIQRAQLMGINPDELIPDRVAKMHKAFDAKLKETGFIDELSKKSVQLNADFNAVTTHLKEMAEQASGPLMTAMSSLLEKTDAWLVRNKDWLVAIGTTLAEDIVWGIDKWWHSFFYLIKGAQWLVDKIKEAIGEAGLKKMLSMFQSLGPLVKEIGHAMHAAMEWAMKPLQLIIDALRGIGLISPAEASTGGAAGGLGGDTGGGGRADFGAGESTGSGGHGAERRGKFGHGGAGTIPGSGPPGSVYSMIDTAAGGDKRVADAMKAIFEGESDHTKGVFDIGDHGASFGPFQMDVEGGRLGAQFQKATGLDPRDPNNQQAVANWVAKYIKDRPGLNIQGVWHGYQHGLERIRRGQVHPNDTVMNVPAVKPPAAHPLAGLHPEEWRKALDTIRAKPVTPWQSSMNEHHDHRVVNSNIAVNVKGNFPVDKTERPLERPKLATFIRNTTAFAS